LNAQAVEIAEDGNIFPTHKLHRSFDRLALNFLLGALEIFLGAEEIGFEEECLHNECFAKGTLCMLIQCILNDYINFFQVPLLAWEGDRQRRGE
jgi:hypothetical protein